MLSLTADPLPDRTAQVFDPLGNAVDGKDKDDKVPVGGELLPPVCQVIVH
jgi:hypothetical protein